MLASALRITVVGIALAATSVVAQADKRVALVIGNSAYQNVARLPNPAGDANAIMQLLSNAGFDAVSLQQDVGNLDFKRAIRRFQDSARDADIAVVFYAGHGIEIGGVNYLIPVDAKLASDLDAPDETIELERLVESVASAKQLGLVILDACRDNPFVVSMKRQRQAALRSVSAGLGKIEPASTGTLVAYAARAGSTAEDGSGDHSPFTTALLHNLAVPTLDIRLVLGRIRDEVMRITNQRQEPFVYGSLGGATVSLVPSPQSIASAAATNDASAEARRDYEEFERVGTKDAWDAFLQLHGSGPYADLARAQRAKLAAAEAAKPSAATPMSPGGPAPGEVARALQSELQRVGCYSGAISGDWNAASRRALDAFNRKAGTTLDAKTATVIALAAVRDREARVCPLPCEPGYVAGNNGTCERAKERARTPAPPRSAARQTPARSAAPQPEVACDRFGCKPVGRGCSVRHTIFRDETQDSVICN